MASDDFVYYVVDFKKIEAKLDKTLGEHEALRAVNRELSAKNQELTRDLATLRRRYTKDIGRRRGDIESASSRRNPPKRSGGVS